MTKTKTPVVAVVDDNDALREAILVVLGSVGIEAAAWSSAREFLAWPGLHGCRCIVLDVRMPGLSGLEAQRRLLDMGCRCPIVFISGHADVEMAVEAMKNGAVDFLQKPFRDQVLINAVQAALERSLPAPGGLGELQARLDRLTPREREILDGVARGLRSKQIAGELGIALKTVEEYRSRLLDKMQVSTSCELIALVSQLARPVHD